MKSSPRKLVSDSLLAWEFTEIQSEMYRWWILREVSFQLEVNEFVLQKRSLTKALTPRPWFATLDDEVLPLTTYADVLTCIGRRTFFETNRGSFVKSDEVAAL